MYWTVHANTDISVKSWWQSASNFFTCHFWSYLSIFLHLYLTCLCEFLCYVWFYSLYSRVFCTYTRRNKVLSLLWLGLEFPHTQEKFDLVGQLLPCMQQWLYNTCVPLFSSRADPTSGLHVHVWTKQWIFKLSLNKSVAVEQPSTELWHTKHTSPIKAY